MRITNAIFVADRFGLIPTFIATPVVRLTAQGEFEGCMLVVCEILSANLRGAPLGRGQALCTSEDLDAGRYDEQKGSRIALGRALEDMRINGMLCKDEVENVKNVLEDALGSL